MKAGRGSEQSAEGVSLWGGSALKEHAHFFAAGTPTRGITHFRQTLCHEGLRAKACLILGLKSILNYSKDLKEECFFSQHSGIARFPHQENE